MAFIGTLRDKMGAWIVVFVFVAISAFVLSDLFGNNSILMNDNTVGEIDGRSISLEEYQNAIREREANYILNFNRQPGDREMPTLRQQAWEMLINRHAIEKQYGKLGIEVTTEEVWDMIQGKNIDPTVRQSFTNPETGQFDQQQVVQYLQQLKSMPEGSEPRVRWEIFQRDLKPARERIKYDNLLIKSTYVTTAEAELDYHLQNDVAEIKYLYIPYFSVSDADVNPTDADFKAYYNKNKEKYKSEHTRDMKFVTVPVVASAQDSTVIREDITRLIDGFKTTQDDSVFASVNTEVGTAYEKYNVSSLPQFVSAEDLVPGNIIGPFIDENSYKLVKISKVTTDTVFNARASHILIRWDNDTDEAKRAAKEKARNILKDLKAGADFTEKAREFGTDGTASRGGDLGWFSSGMMVKPFETAVFAATKTGLLSDVVETEFGYHIIDVTNIKDNKAYYIAIIEMEIAPSDESINDAIRKAEMFAAELSGLEAFEKRAGEQGLTVYEANELTPAERRVASLGEARQVVQWLFRDAEVGKVSEVFDLTDQYVVAVMTGEVEEGYKPLELVKEEITPAVKNELKGKIIMEKLKSLNGSLDEIASAYGSDANVYTNSSLKLNANTLASVGVDPVAIGKAFSLEGGKRSAPYAGENGVIIVETQAKTIAPAIADFTVYKNQLEQTSRNKNSYNIAEAIKDKASIEDKRYKFY